MTNTRLAGSMRTSFTLIALVMEFNKRDIIGLQNKVGQIY